MHLQCRISPNLSSRERARQFTHKGRSWRWKASTEKSTGAEWKWMKYWCIDPCWDPSRVSFCLCNYDLKCHFPTKPSIVSTMQSFCFLFNSPSNLPPLRSRPLLSLAHIHHLRLRGWEKNKSRRTRASERQKIEFIIRKIGFQTTDLNLPREYENGKMPSKFPACWSVNQLIRERQYHDELSVFPGRRAQKTAALVSSCKLFLPLNLQLDSTCHGFER